MGKQKPPGGRHPEIFLFSLSQFTINVGLFTVKIYVNKILRMLFYNDFLAEITHIFWYYKEKLGWGRLDVKRVTQFRAKINQ